MNRTKRKKYIERIAVSAMLIGISVCVGYLCRIYLTFGMFIRITFENLPIILVGILFGPIYGLVAGVSSDLISSVASAQTINPIITVGAGVVGLMAGIVVEGFKGLEINKTAKKILSCISAHFWGCIIIKTLGLYLYYFRNMSFWYLFGVRTAVYVAICPAEIIMVIILTKNKTIKASSDYEL